eukprot:4447476-Pyramimonas_sp.AAC.1
MATAELIYLFDYALLSETMGVEAFDGKSFPGTARRAIQGLPANAAAHREQGAMHIDTFSLGSSDPT